MPYPVAAVRNKNFGNLLYSDLILSLGPIAYWPLNETSGTTAVNLVNTALNGTYTACTLGQAQAPFIAPLFNGTTSFCNIYSAALNAAWIGDESTMSVWVKVSGAGVWADGEYRYGAIVGVDLSTNYFVLQKVDAANTLRHLFVAGSTADLVANNTSASTGWIHLAGTVSRTGNAMKFFINGAQVGTTQTGIGTWAGALGNTRCVIGAASTVPANSWSGWIAHAALFNTALSPTNIANLYAWGIG